MRRLPLILTLAVFTPAAPPARADSPMPFRGFRMVEPTGRYYLVMTRQPGSDPSPHRSTPVDFVIVERRPDSPPVGAEEEGMGDGLEDTKLIPGVKVREGDKVLGRGQLDRAPSEVLLSSTGLGFVGLGVWGHNFGARRGVTAVVVVGPDGAIRHRKDLADLFDEPEIARFWESTGSVHWRRGGWIDERRRRVIVIGAARNTSTFLRVVDLADGRVTKGTTAVVVEALTDADPAAIDFVLDLVPDVRPEAAKPPLIALYQKGDLPMPLRLKAAVALGSLGDRRGAALLKEEAFKAGPGQEYAVRHLPDLFGAEAAPMVREAVRRFGKDVHSPACSAMCVLGRQAVPTLIEMIRERDARETRLFAVWAAGAIGPPAGAAVPDLVAILRENDGVAAVDWWVLWCVANTLEEIGPAAAPALPLLEKLAKTAKAQADRIKAEGKTTPANDDPESFARQAERSMEAIRRVPLRRGPEARSRPPAELQRALTAD